MNDKFVYDETTSILYAPDGRRLKRIYCPKAMDWNQLKVVEGEERWRDCARCKERVVNLDEMDVKSAARMLAKRGPAVCVHGSSESGKVIFLKALRSIAPAKDSAVDEDGRTIIRTVRSLFDMNRAVTLGYWPDVRVVKFDTEQIRTKIAIAQHVQTGHVRAVGDYRARLRKQGEPPPAFQELDEDGSPIPVEENWFEAVPFTSYYDNYQNCPVAAYLIPVGLPDGTRLLVDDPIEDIVGAEWNQGDTYRAHCLPGVLMEGRVKLDPLPLKKVRRFIG